MKTVKFGDLWKSYPGDDPCNKEFKNQCAIRVGAALAGCSVDTTRLVSKKRHCWYHKSSDGHVLAAEELAAGLNKTRVPGIGLPQKFEGEGFRAKIAGKKGIVFFKDYWMRSVDRPASPTGDHIDLWNGSRLTDWSSWARIRFGIVIPNLWSDLEKSKQVIFWQVQS